MGRLKTLRVPVPPFEVQEEFRSAISKIQEVKADAVEQSQSIDTLFSSLQQRAFRGGLDLSHLRLEEDVEALERTVDKLHKVVHVTLPKALCPSPSVPQPSTATPSPRCAPSFPPTVSNA